VRLYASGGIRETALRPGENSGRQASPSNFAGAVQCSAAQVHVFRSDDNGGDCVRTVSSDAGVLVRDTADRGGTMLGFTTTAWAAFTYMLRLSQRDIQVCKLR
jgi:hypothetical protein